MGVCVCVCACVRGIGGEVGGLEGWFGDQAATFHFNGVFRMFFYQYKSSMSALASGREVGAWKMYAFAWSPIPPACLASCMRHTFCMFSFLFLFLFFSNQVGIFAMIEQVGASPAFQDQDHSSWLVLSCLDLSCLVLICLVLS